MLRLKAQLCGGDSPELEEVSNDDVSVTYEAGMVDFSATSSCCKEQMRYVLTFYLWLWLNGEFIGTEVKAGKAYPRL